jgi:uncharacterized protein YdhG (YjbR/CyaY superfamily)
MTAANSSAKDVDVFIAKYPKEVQETLNRVRETIRAAAPEAEEGINYGIPTFFLNGNLVHFSAFKTHIGFYPTPSGIEKFKKELSKYEWAKGSVKFPLNQPIPFALIAKIVKFRVKENLAKGRRGSKDAR